MGLMESVFQKYLLPAEALDLAAVQGIPAKTGTLYIWMLEGAGWDLDLGNPRDCTPGFESTPATAGKIHLRS